MHVNKVTHVKVKIMDAMESTVSKRGESMPTVREKIEGKGVGRVIEQLIEDKNLVTMHLLGSEFQHLTMVSGMRIFRSNRTPMFMVSCTEEFKRAIRNLKKLSFEFHFVDSNKVPCWFNTSPGYVVDDEVWLVLPRSIFRDQKRNDFRMEAPSGTKVQFQRNGVNHVMDVHNISMSGLLSTLCRGVENAPDINVADQLHKAVLSFASERGPLQILIKEVAVARKERWASGPSVRYGFRFVAIDAVQKFSLKKQLYKCQREFLSRRYNELASRRAFG